MIWDHLPAQCFAFHYASVWLPSLWMAAIFGSLQTPNFARSAAIGALMSAAASSFFLGQFPWSCNTTSSVEERTYTPDVPFRRAAGSLDQQFALEQLERIRSAGGSALATGRFAAHLIGASELETVGQFFQHRDSLERLTPGKSPLLRYETIILDRLETFQQSSEQTLAIEREAFAEGFHILADEFEIVVLTRSQDADR